MSKKEFFKEAVNQKITKFDALEISSVSKRFEEEARQLILEGLLERFGFIDNSFNPDLKDILSTYNRNGNLFLIGLLDKELVATGALTREGNGVGRIERMSVKAKYRGNGFAKRMLEAIESEAKLMGYEKIVLETNNDWVSALKLYSSNGYNFTLNDGKRSYFEKNIKNGRYG